jgi:hypothetical protein
VTVRTDTHIRELLAWVAARPRSYDDAIEAWKTSCPQLSVWDDAVSDGLVRIARGHRGSATVTLTELGRVALEARPAR